MAVKKTMTIALMFALFAWLLIPAVEARRAGGGRAGGGRGGGGRGGGVRAGGGRAGGSRGGGMRFNSPRALGRSNAGRNNRSASGRAFNGPRDSARGARFDSATRNTRRALQERRSMVRARIKKASASVAGEGSFTRGVGGGLIPNRTNVGFPIRRQGQGDGFRSGKRSGLGTNLGFRHKRFHHGGHGRHHRDDQSFYYYSVPYYTYYYYYPPYYYSVPYGSYYTGRDYGTEKSYEAPAEKYEKPKEEYKKPDQPVPQTEAIQIGQHLSNIAAAFAKADYDQAVDRAAEALEDAPHNMPLLFIHSQSLFAGAQYTNAAEALRKALVYTDKEKGVFYSLGFYPDETILTSQIELLNVAAQAEPENADMQLLLGYQLLGISQYDAAREALEKAKTGEQNKGPAELLIDVLNETQKMTESEQSEQTG